MRIDDINLVTSDHFVVVHKNHKSFLCRVISENNQSYVNYFRCCILLVPHNRVINIEKTQLAINSEYEVYETIEEVKELYPEIFI